MLTFADRVIHFYSDLQFRGTLPEGISAMNPYCNRDVFAAVKEFYKKFYSDNLQRHLILGINPGRFGAGVTGIPFTDTVRLKEKCGIGISGLQTRETSSVFIYEMIERYGGPAKFYSDFFISAVSPLGFTIRGKNGREVNYNYYDNKSLTRLLSDFIIENLKIQIGFGIVTDVCYCLGTGKNYEYLLGLNGEHGLFGRIEPLEHPRFIMQYRSSSKEAYISKYIDILKV